MKRKQWREISVIISFLAMAALALSGCSSGSDGAPGAPGAAGPAGTAGPQGPSGSSAARVTEFHGTALLEADDALTAKPTTVVITDATADAAGLAKVTFTIRDAAGAPVTGLGAAGGASFQIASLEPKGGSLSYNKWVPYIYAPASVTQTVNMAYRERNAFVEGPAGTYTYTFAKNLATATYPIGGTAITYNRARTHRVIVALRSGYSGGATFDFVPAGGAVTETRNIVQDAVCAKCHQSTPGHYGGMVKACVVCHSPGSSLVNSAANGGATNTMEASVMFHKIHAGRELPGVAGPDGIFFDDPTTAENELADNVPYILGRPASWNSAAFPAVLANCQACHSGSGLENVDNWKTVPSRAACGSCHATVNFETGANHSAGAFTTDGTCIACHQPTGGISPITTEHEWMKKDIRNIPEYDITITTDTPARGYYIVGETPVITMVLKDKVTGVAIDHTTVVEKPNPAPGCVTNADKSACTNAADPQGRFRAANLFVSGPRALRMPVLTTSARAKVTSATAGPWDLSAGGASLRLVVDSATLKVGYDPAGEDRYISGDFTVTLPAAGAALNALFANPAAATAAEVVAWLNGPKATFEFNEREFHLSDRAIAYVEDGKVSIRSRATTYTPNIQVPDLAKNLSGMFTDTGIKVGGYSSQVRARANAANNDPKAVRTAANIKYTLDPIDAYLAKGTYMINVEFGQRGNNASAVPGSYRTPSIAVATFQIGQAATEKPIAENCTSCHWTGTGSTGVGFVLDPIRHNKPFNETALDQCGGCHDYHSTETVGNPQWSVGLGGTKPISKRVHSIHNGVNLNYPVITVDHEESSPGRNWRVTYPMDVRNCESCHPAATTSGTWKTKPNRLACMGCHDSDAASSHILNQTYDPTPSVPWSGDEKESCAACH